MKRAIWLFMFLVLVSGAFATNYVQEYSNYNNLYLTYQSDLQDIYDTIDACILVNDFDDPCFTTMGLYLSTTLDQKKSSLDNLRSNVIALREDYVSSGGTIGDVYYMQVDQLQSDVAVLASGIESEKTSLQNFVDMKYEEKYESDFNTLSSEYEAVQGTIINPASQAEFDAAQATINSIESELLALESEMESYLASNPSADFSSLVGEIDSMQTSIDSAQAQTYGEEETSGENQSSGNLNLNPVNNTTIIIKEVKVEETKTTEDKKEDTSSENDLYKKVEDMGEKQVTISVEDRDTPASKSVGKGMWDFIGFVALGIFLLVIIYFVLKKKSEY